MKSCFLRNKWNNCVCVMVVPGSSNQDEICFDISFLVTTFAFSLGFYFDLKKIQNMWGDY